MADASASGSTGGEWVDQIARDLGCPACGYNLRGLRGPIVDCPECGQNCDIPRLVARKWDKPWWKAPKFNTILNPVAWLYVMFLITSCMSLNLGQPSVMAVFGLVWVGVWGWLMWRAWRVFNGMEGLLLALLGHAVMLGYLAGLVSMFAGFLWAMHPAFSNLVLRLGLIGAGMILGVVLMWVARGGERFIAGRCIKRYLLHVPTHD